MRGSRIRRKRPDDQEDAAAILLDLLLTILAFVLIGISLFSLVAMQG